MKARAGLLLVASLLAGCGSARSARGSAEDRIEAHAALLRAEDTRTFDADLFGRGAASLDREVRRLTALSAGRLRDPSASALLPRLLADPDPSVRRAASFAAGVSGERSLVTPLVALLSDPDPTAAAYAADALGKLGGVEATGALLTALRRPSPVRAPAATALWRAEEPRVPEGLSALASDAAASPAERRSAIYALSRRPRKESAAALRAVLRGNELDPDPDAIAWAARGCGILREAAALPDLVRLASSKDVSVAVQSLLALEKILPSAHGVETSSGARSVAIARAQDPIPGVAVAALRLLGRVAEGPGARATLEETVLRRGWRGQTALVSLTRLDATGAPERVAMRLSDAAATDSLEMKLGACESMEFVTDEVSEAVGPRLLSDGSARVRAAALSYLSKRRTPVSEERLRASLRDASPAVRAAALEASAPRLAASPDLVPSWGEAFARSLATSEPDDVVTALDAAAARGEAGRGLVEARVDDPDAVAREKARRLMVETYGARPGGFARIPVKSSRTPGDYRALARMAAGFGAEVEFGTVRGAFTVELDFGEAPLTAFNFYTLAGRGAFDQLLAHRVVPDFVVQTGDPRGDGTGGPGYSIRDELNPLRYVRGAVGMALSGPDTGGSQWFVALSPQPHLDGGYTVFGRVTAGMEVLDRVEQDDRLLSVRVRSKPGPPAPAEAVR